MFLPCQVFTCSFREIKKEKELSNITFPSVPVCNGAVQRALPSHHITEVCDTEEDKLLCVSSPRDGCLSES